MELKQLDALTAVAEHGRFSAAARALDTVQSNISTHIARLEDDLGALLVDRSAGELTAEGQVVLTRARRINTELAALRDKSNPGGPNFPNLHPDEWSNSYPESDS